MDFCKFINGNYFLGIKRSVDIRFPTNWECFGKYLNFALHGLRCFALVLQKSRTNQIILSRQNRKQPHTFKCRQGKQKKNYPY